MYVRRNAGSVEVLAPAKINLFLEVLGKRADGYHDIETLLVPVSIYDSLIFEPTDSGDIVLTCRWAYGVAVSDRRGAPSEESARELQPGNIPSGRENLAWRAAALLKQRAGVSRGGVIRLVKRIPAAAGLGGASSDAAAALVAASAGWRLNWPFGRLMELAGELGSDVPFFLAGGAGVGRGRGECIERVATTRLNMVIVKPPVGLSTPNVFQACKPAAMPRSAVKAREYLASGKSADLGREMRNGLETAAAGLTPWIRRLREVFSQQEVLGHQMSGSGSSYFGICRSRRQARRVTAALRGRRLGAVMTAATLGGS